MMKIHRIISILSVLTLVAACTSSNKRNTLENRLPNTAGPFSIEKTAIQQFAYDFELKIEAPGGQYAADLAASSPDGTIKLVDAVQVSVAKIDPYTSLPATNIDGTPAMEIKTFPAGTVLTPAWYPAENILIPKGITITYKKIATDQLLSGRFAYYGTAPRFDAEDMEMTASKMGHSLRVKAWVSNDLIKNYEFILLTRFKGFYDAFSNANMRFVKLKSLKKIEATLPPGDKKKWYKAMGFYEDTLLERAGLDIYNEWSDDVTYKEIILTSMIRALMNNNSYTIQDGLNLFNQYKNDSNFASKRQAQSTELFKFHLGDRFTVMLPGTGKADRIGYLTFVYPIAIDKDGPFKLPSTGLRQFPLSVSMESRWWSNRWVDEFGGFPFLQITYDGVAFHGPISITNTGTTETWALKRDDVSHSCMRMDASDLLELRALMPRNMYAMQKTKKTIPLVIQEWPDVTDIDNNGTYEVVDVAYYKVPEYVGQVNNPESWRPEVMNKSYWTQIFQPYVNRLPSKNTFKVVVTTTTDVATKAVKSVVNNGVFTGLPQYKIIKNETVITGYHGETPIMTMRQRPTALIQYREDGVVIKSALNPNDNLGKYPPSYFNKL